MLILNLFLKVVAVAARKLEGSKAFAQKFGVSRSYGSYEELAKDENVGKNKTLFGVLGNPCAYLNDKSFLGRPHVYLKMGA